MNELQQTVARLENEKQLILEQQEEQSELVETIQRDQTLQDLLLQMIHSEIPAS